MAHSASPPRARFTELVAEETERLSGAHTARRQAAARVVELVDAGLGLTVTRRLLEGLAVEWAHPYPLGASACGRIGEVLG